MDAMRTLYSRVIVSALILAAALAAGVVHVRPTPVSAHAAVPAPAERAGEHGV